MRVLRGVLRCSGARESTGERVGTAYEGAQADSSGSWLEGDWRVPGKGLYKRRLQRGRLQALGALCET